MKPMLAPGYVYINARGQAIDGTALLRQLKERKVKFKVTPTDRSFRQHQDALVMTGVCTIEGEIDGQKIDGKYRYLDIFQRTGDRWLAIASTLTRIPDER